jgi:YD repeat-containing protein
MKILKALILLLCIGTAFIFSGCEKESVIIKPLNTDFLLGRIYKGDKLFQEFIYENKKLIRVNYYSSDTVYNYETYEYDEAGRAIKKGNSYGYYETYEYGKSGRYVKLNLYYEGDVIYKTTEYIYNGDGNIEKGIVSFDDADNWNISYTYDSEGNVITRTEGVAGESQFYMSYSEFEYDDKNNPRYNWGLPTDIVQHNNPLRYYNENVLSCMMPPNYRYEYEYNPDGYPVTEFRSIVNTEYIDTFYYEYVK